jgi:hypothetical protein
LSLIANLEVLDVGGDGDPPGIAGVVYFVVSPDDQEVTPTPMVGMGIARVAQLMDLVVEDLHGEDDLAQGVGRIQDGDGGNRPVNGQDLPPRGAPTVGVSGATPAALGTCLNGRRNTAQMPGGHDATGC